MKEKISSRRVNKVNDWLIGYKIPDMSVLSVKDRNKRKSGDLSSDEDSSALNPEKKHEGSYTFNSVLLTFKLLFDLCQFKFKLGFFQTDLFSHMNTLPHLFNSLCFSPKSEK